MSAPTVRGTAIGRDTARIDGAAKVRGAATYAAEFAPTGLVHAGLVQATVPSARIRGIDSAAARAVPGVLAVITHEDAERLEDLPTSGMTGDWHMPLSDDVVHYVGQHVAIVVAESPEAVREARALVRVDYERLEPTLIHDADFEALTAVAVLARGHEDSSDHERGDVDAALADEGAIVVDEVYATANLTHSPMEPHATVAEWANGTLTVHESTQGVQSDASQLATAFRLDADQVRVVCPYVGGAFGNKGALWPHTLLAVMAARRLARPVKLVLTRPQTYSSVGGRPRTVQRVRLAATPEGALTAIAHDSINPTAVTTDWLESCTRSTSATLYASPNARCTQRVARTHVNPPTFMRAPGETPGTFALESAMDELAIAVRMDPLELRRRNHADRSPETGQPWSGKHLLECYDRGAAAFGWAQRTPEPRSMREGGELVGWGMATAVFPGIRRAASANVRIDGEGGVRVRIAAADLGTGAYTVCALVAADVLGVEVDRTSVELGDSDLPTGPLAGGSCTTATAGEAVAAASRTVRAKLLALAAADPGSPLAGLEPDAVDAVGGSLVARHDPSRSLTFEEILAAAGEESIEAEVGSELDAETSETYAMQTHGAHFCEVRIDPLDPRVRVSRVVSVMDVGRVINP
ncbi:MAG: xanthine dehydrogenase, partial [Thermoleophilia bacterium]|nr:xanthine dehydrogenase [Thermoleophilia bacterium]